MCPQSTRIINDSFANEVDYGNLSQFFMVPGGQYLLSWRPIQLAYTPHVTSLLPLGDMADSEGQYSNPESMLLYLPSSLPPDISKCLELKDICEAEHCLCEAQAMML